MELLLIGFVLMVILGVGVTYADTIIANKRKYGENEEWL